MVVTDDIHRYPPVAIYAPNTCPGENAGAIYRRYAMPGVADEITMPVQVRGDGHSLFVVVTIFKKLLCIRAVIDIFFI